MINPLTWLSRRRFPYKPLISVEISRDSLIHNLTEFRKIAPRDKTGNLGMVAPVLKSNAYGHGFREIASILRHERHIPFFVVDSYFEALALRSADIRNQILIIGYTPPETILSSHLRDTVFTVTSLDTLQKLEESEHAMPIHLKIDIGMNRQGLLPDEIQQATDLLSENPLLVLKGICSHLSDADNDDPSLTESQIMKWNKIARHFKNEFPTLEHIHLSATYGHRYTDDIEANVSRLGIGLYGLADGQIFNPRLDLRPVLSMKTIITGLKRISRDDVVGYSATFKAQRDMTLATIPAGYFEGVDRRLSGIGFIGVNHEQIPCRIVGSVSMNITTIDVSDAQDARIGTTATVISNDSGHQNSIVNMAKLAGTIPYEIVVHIPAHLKRTVV